ncbi:MAG: AbrB family transcriptional regulator [Pseudomonadota bacterium]
MLWHKHLFTYAIGLAGVGVFLGLHLPLPWLFGPMAFCLIAALLGADLKTVKPLGDAMRTILGIAVGATVTVAFLAGLPSLWATLIIVPLMVGVIGLVGVWYFKTVAGYDFPTAYYASMPGGLQDMIVFGEEAGGNVRAISLIHATRVLVIVVLLPLILTFVWDANLDRPPGAPIHTVGWDQLGIMAVCGLLGWQGAKRIGLFGASILGPMILAAIASLAGILTIRPPAEAIWAAQYFIAIGIGTKYAGITGAELRHDVASGLVFCLILLVLTAIVVEAVVLLDLATPIDAILSLAPGGQAELLVLALIVGADIGFILAHHLLRILVVILGAPLMARLFATKPMD